MTSKALIGYAVAAALLAAAAVPASAGPTAQGWASDNVEYVTHVPFNNDTSGARIVGKYLYLTTSRDLRIYDISEPESPQFTGFLILPQDPYFSEEDPDTNGNILIVGAGGTLHVVDVEDKSNPQIIGELPGADAHTASCVLDCKWVYNSNGQVVDLRDPQKPKLAGHWGTDNPAKGGHDVTEVAPGMVVTSSTPIMLLDARKDPSKPKAVALGDPEGRFIHGNLWPRKMKDRFLLVGGESVGPNCGTDGAGSFTTWDTRGWRKSKTFKLIDEYRVSQGVPIDGDMPADLFCAHWFTTHPTYRNGGLVAMAWYEHGVRFLDVSKKGKIEEVGYFIPYAGSTSAAYWVNKEILYSVDYNRGFDILRFTGDA